jgi:nucleoside-diphosphate-sugar epimerase
VFGPRQRPDSQYAAVIPLFIDALLTGRTPQVHGDGLQSRDFTFIVDTVRANLLAGTAPADRCAGNVYNIARGEPSSLLDMLGILADQLGVTVTPDHVAPRVGDIRNSHADISAARRDLDYGPSVSFADGLSQTLDWFRERAESGSVSQEAIR